MPPSKLDSIQVRVDALPAVYDALVEAITEAGLNAAELNEIFAQYVVAECLQCGIQLTGEEMGRIALAPAIGQGEDARLTRLHQGYCARKDCESYYYRLVLKEHAKVDWAKAAAIVGQAAAPPAPAVAPVRRVGSVTLLLQDKHARRVLMGLAALLVLLVVRHFMTGGTVPFLHKAPQYTVDPNSVKDSRVK